MSPMPDTTEEVLMIGVETMTAVKNIALILKTTQTKEDTLYVLEKMQQTIKDGNDAINRIEDTLYVLEKMQQTIKDGNDAINRITECE